MSDFCPASTLIGPGGPAFTDAARETALTDSVERFVKTIAPELPEWFGEVTTLTEAVGRAQVELARLAEQYRLAYVDLRTKEEKLRNAIGKYAATFNPRVHQQAETVHRMLRDVAEQANGDLGGIGPGISDRGTGARRGTSTDTNIGIIETWFREEQPLWTTPKLVHKAVGVSYGSAIYAMHIMVHRKILQRIGSGKYRLSSDAPVPDRNLLTPECKRKKPAPLKPVAMAVKRELPSGREPLTVTFAPLPGLA